MANGDSDSGVTPDAPSDTTTPTPGSVTRPRLRRVIDTAVVVVGVVVSGLGVHMAVGLVRAFSRGPVYVAATIVGVVAGLFVTAGVIWWWCGGRSRLDTLADRLPLGPWVRGMIYAVCAAVLVCMVVDPTSGRVSRRVLRASLMATWAVWWFTTVSYRACAKDGASTWRRVGRAADLAAFNLLVVAVLAEAGLRAYARYGSKGFLFQTDAEAGLKVQSYRLKPAQLIRGFPVNAQGFYDAPFTPGKPADTFRILALADSFGVGMVPYPNNFLTQLERRLDARRPAGRRVEVLNTGVQAIGMREYLHILKTMGPTYDPDWVLVCVFVGNDIHRNRAPTLFRKEGWTLYVAGARLWRLWRNPPQTQRHAAEATPLDRPISLSDESQPTFSEEMFLEIERTRLRVARRPLGKVKRDYAYVAEVLAEIKRIVRGCVTVLIIPDEYQVDASLFHKVIEHSRLNAADYDLDQPQRLLGEMCDRLGIDYVDVLPAFRRELSNGPLYVFRDTHWNTRGNRLAAEGLTPVMERAIKNVCARPVSPPERAPVSAP